MAASLRSKVTIGVALVLATASLGATSTHRIEANDTQVFYAYVRAGVEATIRVDGDDDTDLDLEVYSAPGSLAVSDYRSWVDAAVRWTPTQSGFVQVRVINLGPVWNEYTITANGGALQ